MLAEIEKWRDENFNFFKRVKSLVNSKNFRIKEVIYFQLKHFGVLKMLKHIMGIIFILLSPRLYKKLKNKFLKIVTFFQYFSVVHMG